MAVTFWIGSGIYHFAILTHNSRLKSHTRWLNVFHHFLLCFFVYHKKEISLPPPECAPPLVSRTLRGVRYGGQRIWCATQNTRNNKIPCPSERGAIYGGGICGEWYSVVFQPLFIIIQSPLCTQGQNSHRRHPHKNTERSQIQKARSGKRQLRMCTCILGLHAPRRPLLYFLTHFLQRVRRAVAPIGPLSVLWARTKTDRSLRRRDTPTRQTQPLPNYILPDPSPRSRWTDKVFDLQPCAPLAKVDSFWGKALFVIILCTNINKLIIHLGLSAIDKLAGPPSKAVAPFLLLLFQRRGTCQSKTAPHTSSPQSYGSDGRGDSTGDLCVATASARRRQHTAAPGGD